MYVMLSGVARAIAAAASSRGDEDEDDYSDRPPLRQCVLLKCMYAYPVT